MSAKERTALPNRADIALASDPAGPPVDLRYDYEQIDAEHRQQVRSAAVEIKRSAQTAQQHLIAIGQRLLEVKEMLPHGQFGDWLTVEFDLSDRMAQRMMNVAQVYGANPTRVSGFSDSAIYLLASPSTPEEARQAAEAQAQEAGRPLTRTETQKVIDAHKPPPSVWQLERGVRQWVHATVPASPQSFERRLQELDTLATAKEQAPHWLSLTAVLPAGWRKGDLLQAIRNVRQQMLQDQRRRTQSDMTALRQAGVELPPELVAAGFVFESDKATKGWVISRNDPRGTVRYGYFSTIAIALDYCRQALADEAAAPPSDATPTWAAGAVGLDRDWSEQELEDYAAANAVVAPPPAPHPVVDDPAWEEEHRAAAAQPFSAQVKAANAARCANLRHLKGLYANVLATLNDYETLTGHYTHTPPLKRAVEPMLAAVESMLAALCGEGEKAQ